MNPYYKCIELGIFLTKKPGTWGKGGTSVPKKIKDSKMLKTKHFNWRDVYTQIHHCCHLWQMPHQRLYLPEEPNNSSALVQGLSCTPYVCSLLLSRSWWCITDAGFSSSLLKHTVGRLIKELLLLLDSQAILSRKK